MSYRVKRVETAEDLERAYSLRREVFVDEQAVPVELERDEHDATADHVIAEDDTGRLVATGRLVVLDRIALSKHLGEILLHAQLTARRFYDRAGYVAEGEEFEEAGIGHVSMRKRLT